MQLTLVHDATADEIRQGFQAALEANDVDVNSPDIQDIFHQLTFDLSAGSKVTFAGFGDARDQFVIEYPGGVYRSHAKGLSDTMWESWFGKVTDADSQALKDALIGSGFSSRWAFNF